MERKTLIYAGVLCWSAAALDAMWHLANGDLVVPVGMASVGVAYVGVRQAFSRLRRPAPIAIRTDA